MVNYEQFLNFPSSYKCKSHSCQIDDSSVSVSPTHNVIQTWSELLAPLVNMIKEGCENESASLILLIFYLKKSQKFNLSLENKSLKWEEISL